VEYLYVLDNIKPFPDDEYKQLVEYFVTPVDLVRQKTLPVRGSRSEMGYRNEVFGQRSRLNKPDSMDMFCRVTKLREEGEHTSTLINLRLVREFHIKVGKYPHNAPWVRPLCVNTDLTESQIDLTKVEDDDEPINVDECYRSLNCQPISLNTVRTLVKPEPQ
jgi:hypothetical protein